MPWKINSKGEYTIYHDDPEKIEEIDPPGMVAFGVSISSRYGQVWEVIEILEFVNSLAHKAPQTLLTIESVFKDTKGCVVDIQLREDRVPGMGTYLRKRFCDEVAKHYLAVAPGAQLVVSGSDETYMTDYGNYDDDDDDDDSNVVTINGPLT